MSPYTYCIILFTGSHLTYLITCGKLLVSEEVFNHIYHTIGDNSDSPLTGDQGIDPIPVEIDSIHPSPREDFSEIPVSDGDEQYSNEYQDSHSGSHPSFSGEKGQLPCIEDNDH